MAQLPITIAVGDYDRTVALRTGDVSIEGCDPTFLNLSPGELFFRLFTYHEFDVAEMSLSTYMLARTRGDWPYVALPVFLSRQFPHGSIYVRSDAGIAAPEDLKGRRVGIPNYHLTRGLSVRGVLQDEYGVRPHDLNWRVGGVDRQQDFDYVGVDVPGVEILPIASDDYLSRLMVDGEIDAIISYRDPQILTDGHPAIRRLFENSGVVERDYHARTGVYPIMHIVGVRAALIERHPWLARSLMKAFEAAKSLWLSRYTDLDAPAVALPWLAENAREAIERMGADFWPYGIERNRTTLEAQTRWSYEQGLSTARFAVEELFAESTRTWYQAD